MSDVEVLCGAQYSVCICGEPPGHEPPHVCDRASAVMPDGKCLGQWQDGPDGDVQTVRYPMGGATESEALDCAEQILGYRPRPDLPRAVRGGIRFR